MSSGSGRRAVLSTMLDRLLAGLLAGPNLNCRPHRSRQRIDLTTLSKLADATPESVLHGLLGPDQSARVVAKVRAPRKAESADAGESPKAAAFREQQALVAKLRTIVDDARTYENDTGVAALAVGFPLLSVPPPAEGEGKRVLAPIAFVPVSMAVRAGGAAAIDLAGRAEAGDRVRPNEALLAWVEQQTGRSPPEERDDDADPWGEIDRLVKYVAAALDVANPFPPSPPVEEPAAEPSGPAEAETTPPFQFTLAPAPHGGDDEPVAAILPSAVLGLFPVANQGLLRDTRALLDEDVTGPAAAFLSAGVDFGAPPAVVAPIATPVIDRPWLAAAADPCQARAVALARDGGAVVVHGPPGTGKSQTITNVIADHLLRGQRVLLVCDKRTALDVVADRLDRLGLRHLCGIVHDPRRDQRDLYRTLKEQLDALAKAPLKPQAQGQLDRVDAELQKVHDDLLAHHRAVMDAPADGGPSFSDLVGRWLALETDNAATVPLDVPAVTPAMLDAHRAGVADLLDRARSVDWPHNPWARCAGATLADYLARPMADVRQSLTRCAAAGATADGTIDPAQPVFADVPPLAEQATARAAWAKAAVELLPAVRSAGLVGWAGRDAAAVRRMAERVRAVLPTLADVAAHPLDDALRPSAPPAADVARDLAAVRAYLAVAGSWSAAFAFGAKGDAKRVLARFGLPLDKPSADRAAAFLAGQQARATVATVWAELTGSAAVPTDEQLGAVTVADAWLDRLAQLADTPALVNVGPAVGRADFTGVPASAGTVAAEAATPVVTIDGLLVALVAAPARAESLTRLDDALHAADLFAPAYLADAASKGRRGERVDLAELIARADTVEGVLRVRDARAAVPVELGSAVDAMVTRGVDPPAAVAALDRAVVQAEIARRLRADPQLQGVDARKLDAWLDQHRHLSDRRRELVRDAVDHRWLSTQKDRFLSDAGTRLNGAGADLKRRLTSRGKNARRLRQNFAGDGGAALLDLCPVWMASPETVAQVFPRRPVFDVVIFDEASQARLEEAIPVLVRGRRAVIAGDPHQLPPTRFFESGFVQAGEVDDDDGDEQSLFESHQASVEDLLSAALNLSVRQCYLDVHYRSRSADLIAFSNRHFYAGRLVPIPTPPAAGGEPAVVLHRVGGVYERRTNLAEADAVVGIVRELLGQDDPPSVGVACLNLPQRDLIVDRLDAAAEDDADFARRLAAARARGADPLFVKNLENVQGDERDQIIISTTYGPGPDGKFFRRFGPLGMPGGGRRLNVLVTRARDRVHLVTSIPRLAYGSLPPVPDGEQAGGAWLLFAYLRFAEDVTGEGPTTGGNAGTPSPLVDWLAGAVTAAGAAAEAYRGNDGFCVDVAPAGGSVARGVLVDGCRYTAADDPVDWDAFRTGVLAGQGWRLTRVWSPHLFRDPAAGVRAAADAIRPAT